jgi:hypothetical protein
VLDDRPADEPGGLVSCHLYVNDGGAVVHADVAVAPSVTLSPVKTCSPPYGAPLSFVIDVWLIVGAPQLASITVFALPLRPDSCPTATTLSVYVPGSDGVKVGDDTLASLKPPPPGPETTDHANE